MMEYNLPQTPKILSPKDNEIFMLTNGDLRESANTNCWPVQQEYEEKLKVALKEYCNLDLVRIHDVDSKKGHGFISSQREGSDILAKIDSEAPLIILLTAWQYSHHIAPSLVHHKGPILVLANFDGTWPGLVGALCLSGTLNSLECKHSRLWSENFNDNFFIDGLKSWVKTGEIHHDLSYLKPVSDDTHLLKTEAGEFGKNLGEWVLQNKEIMGIFDSFCMGMINGVFPQKALCDIGMPMEGLSQSALAYEMSLVTQQEKEDCLNWYIDQGMNFHFGHDDATELTKEQVLEQCAMLIAMTRFVDRFKLSLIGVQYQQGLKDVCPASDFAEGAIGSKIRYPVKDDEGKIIHEGKPIPCANEVDLGTAIHQLMLYRILDSLNLPSETTLHDVRWGSEYNGQFYWDFEISGAVPFEHIKGGIKGAQGYRQSPMYFAKGGSTIGGQCKKGHFVWARASYLGDEVHMHIGTGEAFELPEDEFQRRLNATTKEWPLMNATLHGMGRDDLMAGHQSNHITIAYVDEKYLAFVTNAFVAMALTQNMRVWLAGEPKI
ncbi:MAG: signal transduction protein [Alphaproteobacteria bacterium]